MIPPSSASGARLAPPLSTSRQAGSLLFLSGQLPRLLDGAIERGPIEQQTDRVIDNIEAALAEHGLGLADVVKTTVWLTDVAHFNDFNGRYAARFSKPYPARSTVIAQLVAPADIEIEAVAAFPDASCGGDGT